MNADTSRVAGAGQMAVCPRCGHRQVFSMAHPECDRCGYRLDTVGASPDQLAGDPIPGQADPAEVAPPAVAGGIGRTTDGTQVPRQVPTAVPGKPMAPIAQEPAGNDTLLGETMDTPPTTHTERGGSG